MKFNQSMLKGYQRVKRDQSIGRLLFCILLFVIYYSHGYQAAVLFGVAVIIYYLGGLMMALNYSNYLQEKSVGFHDLNEANGS